jgi:hypothetical protein
LRAIIFINVRFDNFRISFLFHDYVLNIYRDWFKLSFLRVLWSDKMKIINYSWSFCSRKSWIFRICSIFFFVVKKRSYSFDWTFTFRFSIEMKSRFDDVFIICAFCVFDDVVVFETCSILDNVVVFDSMSFWFRIIDEIINDLITFI